MDISPNAPKIYNGGNCTMANLKHYRQCIQTILTKHSSFKPKPKEVEIKLIFDTTHDHYQLMYVSWNRLSRIYHSVIHFDIKDGKIWIQQNMTDVDLVEELQDLRNWHKDFLRWQSIVQSQ